ncbi:MAG: hypothetical protein P4L75_06240 [Clostridia bacterium]|nr:hypothetical protein [Clostridia bacterium]MDR3645562.1 hypothetical protein [Clostridia bacterium]
MEAIKAWAMTLCFAAVAAGMAGVVAPTGSMEKVYKFVVSVFFLACVLVPFFSIRQISLPQSLLEDSGTTSSGYAVQSLVSQQQTDAARIKISQLVCSCCKKYGVSPQYVYIDFSGSSSALEVSGIRVVVTKSDYEKKKQLVEACKTQLGLDVQIEAKGE